MQALAKQEVGGFLSQNFVSVHDRVGSFEINVEADGRARRNGGNVAAFFCTPRGYVIHVAAGPRTAEAFLSEAKWAVSVYSQIVSDRSFGRYETRDQQAARVTVALRRAHAEAFELLKKADPDAPGWQLVWNDPPSNPKLAGLDEDGKRQRKLVHQLLANRAFEPIGSVGPVVYKSVLGEKVTSRPVQLSGGQEAQQGGRTGQSLLEFYEEGGVLGVEPPPIDDRATPPKTARSTKPKPRNRK